ncbi:type IV pilus assembly PilZ [Sphingopyxis fribergensis]|uniref:Type IV pilus assembly PilZ n=1 Tax=Sphingopyxis fribergensis TaxID=1515612 RepID=A0A0A7PE50_9SPHN|nr:type IV pilus assembly PilZ [Sphingopyxis fribergensis]
MPIYGHFLPSAPGGEKRFDARRKLSLLASGLRHDGTGLEVQIHNISGTGLLLESDVKLAAGDRIEIELPHAGDITAVVIWASGRLFGCQFEGPVSPATLSAVELKSAIDAAPAIDPAPTVDGDPVEPVIDEAAPEGMHGVQEIQALIDYRREQIARDLGIGADRVRIVVEF